MRSHHDSPMDGKKMFETTNQLLVFVGNLVTIPMWSMWSPSTQPVALDPPGTLSHAHASGAWPAKFSHPSDSWCSLG